MRLLGLGGGALVLIMLVAATASAQDLQLSGHVAGADTAPLAHAQVLLEGTGIGGLTDGDGNYAFILSASRLHGQTAKLTAQLIGFKKRSVDVVLSGVTLRHDFVLDVNPITCCFDPIVYPPPYMFTTADFLRDHADITHAAGLKDLRTRHRNGDRELRIWRGGAGMMELYRIAERSGEVNGERIRYYKWIDTRGHDEQLRLMLRLDARGCSRVTTGGLLLTCRKDIPADAEWKQPWRELEAAGIWDLPSEPTLEEPMLIDESIGEVVTVELWDGQAYRAWSYVSPYDLTIGRGIEGHERAYAIWRVTRGIDLLSKQ
jgi:hypothetical protein